MRFSLFTSVIAAGSFVLAAPMPQATSVASALPSLSAGQALAIISQVNSEITGLVSSIKSTASSLTSGVENTAAVSQIETQVKQITAIVSTATGNLTQQATGKGLSGLSITVLSAPDASVQEAATALKSTLDSVNSIVTPLVKIQGLSSLTATLTGLTGSVSGLVATIQPLVGGLISTLTSLVGGLTSSVPVVGALL